VKATDAGEGKGKGKGKRNVQGKVIVKTTTGGDIISAAVAVLLQKEMNKADLDMKGELEGVYLDLEPLPST
jgi:hypothetical protein